MITIERGVPIPPYGDDTWAEIEDAASAMEIGDSFLHTSRTGWDALGDRLGFDFHVRRVAPARYRIWRVG